MITFRWCEADDWEELGRVHCLAYHSAYRTIMPQEYLETVTVEKKQAAYRTMLVRESIDIALLMEGNTAIGILRVSEPEANRFQLEELYLLESCRGKGYGTSFLAWLEQELINRGGQTLALWVLQDNWGAVRFYERYGFEGIGEERMIERGQTFKQIKYAKQLSIIG